MAESNWIFVLIAIAVIFPLSVGGVASEFELDYVFPLEEVKEFGFDFLDTSESGFIVSVLLNTLNVVLFIVNMLIMFFGFLAVILNNFVVVLAYLPVSVSISVSAIYTALIIYIIVKMLPTT